ncbi:MAG: VOC family protein, partial [Bacteroidota bacterium]
MNEDNGTVRFTYFTDKFQETYDFYTDKLDFELEHSWDRNEHDKGALFKAGDGLIEVLQLPNNGEMVNTGLEHRSPQGAFMFIQIGNIDQLFATYKASEI